MFREEASCMDVGLNAAPAASHPRRLPPPLPPPTVSLTDEFGHNVYDLWDPVVGMPEVRPGAACTLRPKLWGLP